MGANFGAVYLRGARRKQVRDLLKDWSAQTNARCLMAPEIGGWRAVYPQDYGQDGELARRLAAEVDGVVLHVYVHDDFLLGYCYYREGEKIDEYCSDPAYVDDAPRGEAERLRGQPRFLAELLVAGKTAADLDRVLHPADGTLGLASFALKDFARLLNLPNPCTCYEYLMEDGWIERVLRWVTVRSLWRFEHIPSLRAEKAARKTRLSRRAEGWQELKEQGLLLALRPGRVGWVLNSEPHLCANSAGDGFYVFWSHEKDRGLTEHSPPWDGPREAPAQTEPTRSLMSASPSGRWLAIGHRDDSGRVELWDMSQPAKVAELESAAADHFDFSSDEKKLLAVGAGELSVWELPGGKLIKRSRIGGDAVRAAFDPSGRFALLVLADELVLFDWRLGRWLRRWKLGERIDPPPEIESMQEDLAEQLSGMAAADFDTHFLKMARQMTLPTAAVEEMLAEVREQQREMVAAIDSEDWSESFGPRGSELPCRVQFSRDGKWLLCATDVGARVYRWAEFPGLLEALESDLPTAGKGQTGKPPFQMAPAPAFAADGEPYQEDGEEEHFSGVDPGRNIYALAYDSHRDLVVYAGLGGAVNSLDLASGERRTLVELPGRPAIMDLCLSRDGHTLACATLPQFFRSTQKIAPEVCIWNYSKLLAP
jgi:hypothetical protein